MRTFLAAALLAAALPCLAAFTPFGTACTLENPTPSIGNLGLPQIGTTFSITYTGPNYLFNFAQQSAQPFLALGTQTLGITIPTAGLIYQPANCTAYVLPVSLIPMLPQANAPQYETSFALTIPNDPALVGFQFLAQWLTVHSQCGFSGCGLSALVTSDAATITVGL